MHGGGGLAVAGYAQKARHSSLTSLYEGFERAAFAHRDFPLIVFDKHVHLPEIDVVGAQQFERAFKLGHRLALRALFGLCGEKH